MTRFSLPLRALVAFVGMLAVPVSVSAMQPIDGRYVDAGGFVEITVGSCGNARCGTITRIIKNKPGEPDNDVHNDDPALRDRPILGIRILKNLRWEGDAWRGRVYNPEDGGTYKVHVKPASGGRLEVKGCVAFLCRTQIWTPAR